jgi:hypothetical protein
MYSLLFITIFLLISLYLFGVTASISDLHYKYFKRFGFYGYLVFPVVMITWAILVAFEAPQLALSAMAICGVGIFAMFKCDRVVHWAHYLLAALGIFNLMFVVWSYCFWLVLSFVGLSLFTIQSKYRIYIIEILAIIILYIYLFNAF